MWMPRWLAFIVSLVVWILGVPLAHAVVPWLIASFGTRYGWVSGSPGPWNLLGVVPLAVGAAGLLWVMPLHLRRMPAHVKLEWTPTYLLERGPYAFTRNPMYVGEILLWLGQAILYGSLGVFAVGTVLLVAMNFRAIPREERALEARFGERYREYTRRVPRWLGSPRGAVPHRPKE